MTYYYKQIDETGEVVALFTYDFAPVITNPLVVEIDREEYDRLLEALLAEYEAGTE